MKKFLCVLLAIVLLCAALPFGALAEESDPVINFPDPNFEAAVRDIINKPAGDIYQSDVADVASLFIRGLNIADLTGIEYFTKLYELECAQNAITELDISKNVKLGLLDCSVNHLTTLDVSANTQLDILDCSANALTELDVSNCPNLLRFYCSMNFLTELDVTNNTELEYLACGGNSLTSLDVSKNKKLEMLNIGEFVDVMLAFSFAHLYADNPFYDINEYAESLVNMFGENWQEHGLGNNISELDISNNVMLSSLACGSNNISSLDLSKLPNLDLLACADNNLTTLDVSQNPKLTVLWCSNNYLTVESTEIGAEHTLLDESFSNYFYVEQATPSANFWFYPQKTITPPPTQKYHDFDTSETLIVDVPLSAAEGVYNFSLWQGGNGAPDLVVNSDGVYVHDGYIAGDLYLNGNDLTAANKLSVGGNIYINGSGVTLSNFSCNGTIYINAPGTTVKNGWAPRIIVGAGVGDGEVFINQYATAQVIRDLELTNATVPDLFIYGGGSHSVVVTNSVFGNVYVDKSEDSGKETVTVKLFGNTQIDALELLSDANIVTDADSAVTNLTVNSTAKNVAVTGGGTIVNAVIARGSNVSFENPPQNLTDSNLGATQTWWSQIAQWFTHIFEQITGFFKQVFGI